LTTISIVLFCRPVFGQEIGCAFGYVHEAGNVNCPVPRAIVTIDGVESETADERGYYAIRIPEHTNRVIVTARRGDYQAIDSDPAPRSEMGHVTRVADIPLPRLIQATKPVLRAQLQREQAALRTARSGALRASIAESVGSIGQLLASTRYTDQTVVMSVPVVSMECRRVMRPTPSGCVPTWTQVPVRRCELRPFTTRQFDVDTPQEAQANAESIRLAESLLHSLRPQMAAVQTGTRAF
jgi:hypothetical protein